MPPKEKMPASEIALLEEWIRSGAHDQLAGNSAVPLLAKADSGMKVRFFVVAGPAKMEGDALKLTPVPPRTRFPVEITVSAWQWGRSIEPRVQTAKPVPQTFRLLASKPVD